MYNQTNWSGYVRSYWRPVFLLLAGAFAIYTLSQQAQELRQTAVSLHAVRWRWMFAGLLGSALTYPLLALSLRGATGFSVPLRHTTLVQLATSFVNLFGPQGLAGMTLSARYLERANLHRTRAVSAVGLSAAAYSVACILGIAVVLPLLHGSGVLNVRVPGSKYTFIAILVLPAIFGLMLWLWRNKTGKLARALLDACREIMAVLRHPAHAAALFGGSASTVVLYTLILAACMHAFGSDIPVYEVAAVYLGANVIATLSPVPSGLGATEAALLAGLIAFGVDQGPALESILAYRLLTYWLPMLPGILALRYLRVKQLV